MYTILPYIPYSSKVSSAEPEGWAAVVSINLSSITDSSMPPQVAKTLENDIFPLFLILIPTKSGTFAHCGLVLVNKASTDGGELQPSSLTGGRSNLQPSNPYLQKAAIQPYRKPAQSAAKHPLSAESCHPALPEACPVCSQATPICSKQPYSPTGGQPNLQQAPIQPYRRPTTLQEPPHPSSQPPQPCSRSH